jgi:CheY-like chemotaxis protein
MVRLNSEHLMELITDVLDYAKIESGKMNPTPVALTVNDQLLELSRMVRAQADAKGHVVRCRDASEEPAVQCDRRHFRQMMLNLLTNAIKYTPDGGTIEIWSEKGDAGLLKICVRDSGVGISEKDRSRVFTPFERLQHAYSSTQQGTGLGLSLTKRLAEINGGSVHFDSVVNVGTTFWIELPSTRAERALSTADQLPHHPVRSSGEQILIAGSGDEERILLSRYLRGLGYGVHMVEDERAARGILRTNTIALVIFGEGFRPEVAGTLANFVRDEQGARYIPVVLLTRNAFLVDVERYLREDIDRCLTKPVRLEELAVACRQAIDLTRGG